MIKPLGLARSVLFSARQQADNQFRATVTDPEALLSHANWRLPQINDLRAANPATDVIARRGILA
jgi:hypothetical protein